MPSSRTVSFDGWVLRTDLGELTKDGNRTRLQDQPLQILDELLLHPGELVTREQLIARLWPTGVVDFDTGLNSAVRKLRKALQDEAETPRYIETVPRRGYRFIGIVDPVAAATESAGPLPGIGNETRRRIRPYIYVAATAAILLAAAVFVPRPGTNLDSRTQPSAETGAPLAPARPMIAVLPLQPSDDSEDGKLLAQGITSLIHDRLAMLRNVTVISPKSAAQVDFDHAGQKLNAQYVLHGSVERTVDRLHLQVQLQEVTSGSRLWSRQFEPAVADIQATREEIVQQVANSLQVEAPAISGTRADLDAYQLYVRGQRLMSTRNPEDVKAAAVLFSRTTTLDPSFARGYLSMGQALLLSADLRGARTDAAIVDAQKAFDRALELNPSLGEAWIERAELTRDPAEAEPLYRRGLELAPSYDHGYEQFSNFLFRERRRGEAIEMIDRALQLDPLSPLLYTRKALWVMVSRSDVAENDRLLQRALAIDPDFRPALLSLAVSKHQWSGKFAEAVQLAEQALARDSKSMSASDIAASLYLDMDDPAAAQAVLQEARGVGQVEIAQYRRDPRTAAQIAATLPIVSMHSLSSSADAVRDHALALRSFDAAIELLEPAYASWTGPPLANRGVALVYAHTLLLAGETERGRQLATSLLVHFDTEAVGRTDRWFSRERAAVFAMLGDDDRAISELEASQKLGHYARWWYTAELDPLYERLRQQPRFQALAAAASEHRRQQRALLEEMRRKGAIPQRPERPTAGLVADQTRTRHKSLA